MHQAAISLPVILSEAKDLNLVQKLGLEMLRFACLSALYGQAARMAQWDRQPTDLDSSLLEQEWSRVARQ